VRDGLGGAGQGAGQLVGDLHHDEHHHVSHSTTFPCIGLVHTAGRCVVRTLPS
jgi:hypothetical protein